MNGTLPTLFGDVPEAKKGQWDLVEYYFQPLKPLFETPDVTEIFVDRFDKIRIERQGKIEQTQARFRDESDLVSFIEQVARCLDQALDKDNPILDARLPDCSRLCCTMKEVTPQGATITLRVVPKTSITAEQLVSNDALPQSLLDTLQEHVRLGSNILVSGNTGSGKTTLLRVLAHSIPSEERVVTCEDTQELYLDWLPYLVSLEAPKRKNSPVVMKTLIETALRMRPDRIWVGEIRHASAADAFLQAINTGHSGCVTTIHANNCKDAINRLQYLVSSAGLIDFHLAQQQILGAVDLIIQTNRSPLYGRKVIEVLEIKNGQFYPVYSYS